MNDFQYVDILKPYVFQHVYMPKPTSITYASAVYAACLLQYRYDGVTPDQVSGA
jgi:hypothetical protein